MLIEERFRVMASIQSVWDFLMDPEKIGSCIPGCEKVTSLDERNYLASVKAAMGPISFKFNIHTEILELNPPYNLRSVSRGEDNGKKGRVRQETTVEFTKISENETEVYYKAEVTVVGRLATFGFAIMRAKIKELGQAFANSVKEKLEKTK
jgi:carbon monoxide dehydrogenase subunit G